MIALIKACNCSETLFELCEVYLEITSSTNTDISQNIYKSSLIYWELFHQNLIIKQNKKHTINFKNTFFLKINFDKSKFCLKRGHKKLPKYEKKAVEKFFQKSSMIRGHYLRDSILQAHKIN